MIRFYDPGNAAEQAEVESLLKHNGIEYFLKSAEGGSGPSEILVAEEDLPQAQKLIDEMNQSR